jgi:hypothetical protein
MVDIPWTSLLAIAGVIVGFSLSQTADLIKSEKSKRTIKKALVSELSSVRDDLSYAVNHEFKMPRDRLPFVTETYDSSKARLATVLKPHQLTIVQKAYLQIKQVGAPLKNGDTLCRGYLEHSVDEVAYQHDLNNERKLIQQAVELLEK